MATIYDIAKRAKVSTYTVSSVLNKSAYVSPELTARVLDAVRHFNYAINEVARSLQTRKTRTMGMLIPNVGAQYYGKVVGGVEDRLRKAGYSLLLGNTYDDPEEQGRYLSLFRAKVVEGVLLFVAAGPDPELEQTIQEGRPLVFVGRVPRGRKADSVSADNVAGARLAVEHLIACGRRRIGIVTGQRALSTAADRVEGWKKALRKHKLAAPEKYVGEGDWTEDSGYRLGRRLLELDAPVTGLFAANFQMMTGVLRALQELGLRCPEDVQVASFDDSEWLDVFRPPVTTVLQPSYEIGEQAAELLLKRIENPRKKFEQVVLTPSLRIRP